MAKEFWAKEFFCFQFSCPKFPCQSFLFRVGQPQFIHLQIPFCALPHRRPRNTLAP